MVPVGNVLNAKDILSSWKFADWDSYGTESFWGSQNSIEDYLK